MPDGYDVIGDVHGESDALVALLARLSYRYERGAWRHSSRHAVFVGDLIDRGPQQLEAVDVVRRMVEAGSASIVMGNHEFNAIALATFDTSTGDFARTRLGPSGERHLRTHRGFLDAVGLDSPRHRKTIEWFRTMPFHLQLDGLRVVHACWHAPSLELLDAVPRIDDKLPEEFILNASRRGTGEHRAVEVVAKGPEVDLGGFEYLDRGDHRRSSARLRWWDRTAASLSELAAVPSHATGLDGGPIGPLPARIPARNRLIIDEGDEPVIFGHYWMTGTPQILGAQAACVDYSAAAGGPLVAYRWSGERTLESANFVGSR